MPGPTVDRSIPTAGLVDRRAELLGAPGGDARDSELDIVTDELRRRLADVPTVVRRIDPAEPGELPNRLAALEPVHPIAGPADLADRLDVDRRLFALQHPLLPDRPMNVVWVALCTGVPTSIHAVLDPTAPALDPGTADTAVFYSIWNAEPGLDGLGRGRDLIEGAVGELRTELPGLSTFVTLSPIPGYRAWAVTHAAESGAAETGARAEADEQALLCDCATYLTTRRHDGRPLDPVARFHLGNGARLWRINARADLSDRGRQRSWGLMANYRYEPEDRAANRAQLTAGTVPVSDEVRALLG